MPLAHNNNEVFYKLPDLHEKWPFPRTVNPWYDEVTPASVDWLDSFGIFSEQHRQNFRKVNSGLLSSLANPHHTKEHLRCCTDLLNILYTVDDVTDVLPPAEVREIADICLDAMM